MMKRLLDIEITEYGTITEEVELICTMTGFRSRFLVHHMGEGGLPFGRARAPISKHKEKEEDRVM